MLSPSSILPPPPAQSAYIAAGKIMARVYANVFFIFFLLFQKLL
jgi:hypothetical protein